MKKYVILFFVVSMGNLYLFPHLVRAQDECCGDHGGVIYCNQKADRLQCYDGTLSKTCTCEGIISHKPSPTLTKKIVKKVVVTPTEIPITATPTAVESTPTSTPTTTSVVEKNENILEIILRFLGLEK